MMFMPPVRTRGSARRGRRGVLLAPVGAENGSVALTVAAVYTDVPRSVMTDATDLVSIVFSGSSALVIEDAEDAGEVICVQARTAYPPRQAAGAARRRSASGPGTRGGRWRSATRRSRSPAAPAPGSYDLRRRPRHGGAEEAALSRPARSRPPRPRRTRDPENRRHLALGGRDRHCLAARLSHPAPDLTSTSPSRRARKESQGPMEPAVGPARRHTQTLTSRSETRQPARQRPPLAPMKDQGWGCRRSAASCVLRSAHNSNANMKEL